MMQYTFPLQQCRVKFDGSTKHADFVLSGVRGERFHGQKKLKSWSSQPLNANLRPIIIQTRPIDRRYRAARSGRKVVRSWSVWESLDTVDEATIFEGNGLASFVD